MRFGSNVDRIILKMLEDANPELPIKNWKNGRLNSESLPILKSVNRITWKLKYFVFPIFPRIGIGNALSNMYSNPNENFPFVTSGLWMHFIEVCH